MTTETFANISKINQWNPFNSPIHNSPATGNYNVALCGKAGVGITYLLRNIALTIDKKVFVIDGCDFAKSNVNPSLDLKNNEDIKVINFTEFPDPFSCIDWKRLSDESDEDELFFYLMTLLTSICRPYLCDSKSVFNKKLKPISDAEKTELGIAIEKALINKENISLQTIADNLSDPSLKEPLDNFIKNKQFFDLKNLNTSKRLTVFRIDDLPEPDKSTATIVLLQLIRQELETLERKEGKIVIMDDIRYLLSDVSSARFAYSLSRISRRYNASFITSNQDIGDYYNHRPHSAIFDNSDWKLFLQSSRASIDSACDNLKRDLPTDLDLRHILPNLSKFNKKEALIICSEGQFWTEFDLPDFNSNRM